MSLRLRSKRLLHVYPGESQNSSPGGGATVPAGGVTLSTSSRRKRNPVFQPTVPGYCANWHTHGRSVGPGVQTVTCSSTISPPRADGPRITYSSAEGSPALGNGYAFPMSKCTAIGSGAFLNASPTSFSAACVGTCVWAGFDS